MTPLSPRAPQEVLKFGKYVIIQRVESQVECPWNTPSFNAHEEQASRTPPEHLRFALALSADLV